MAALFGVCFGSVLLGARTFYFRDFSLFGYPLAAYLHDRFWAGELPLWNPYNNCGLPFLAQWNTMALYPGSLFYQLLPLPWSLNVFCLAHLALGGFGMRRLIFYWTQNRFASDAAGLLFTMNGLALNCLMWPNNSAALGWMPWLICELARANQRNLALAGLFGAMQMLTGAPEVILFTWMVGAVLADRRKLPWVAASGVLAAILAAPQLLPFAELFLQSQRTGGSFATADWALSLKGLGHLLVPLFNASPTPQGVYLQESQKWTSSFYVGVLTLALAFVAGRDARGRKLLAIALASLAFATGLMPLGAFRYPVKWVVPAVFSFAALAGLAIAQTAAAPSKKLAARRLTWGAGILTIGLVLLGVMDSAAAVVANAVLRGIALWAGVFFLRKQMAWGVLAIIALDLLTHTPWQNPTVPADLLKPAVAANQNPGARSFLTLEGYNELRSQMLPEAGRDLSIRRAALLQNLNLIDQIPKLDGFYSLYPMREREFRQALYLSDLTDIQPALDFLGVERFTEPGNVFAWKSRTNRLPMVTCGQQPAYAREGQILRRALSPEFRPLETVYIHDRAAEIATPRAQRIHDGKGVVEIKSIHPQRIDLKMGKLPEPAMIVVAQSYDENWLGYDEEGKPLRKWRVNYNFLGFEAPAGLENVTIRYHSWKLDVGFAMAWLAIFLITATMGFEVKFGFGVEPNEF